LECKLFLLKFLIVHSAIKISLISNLNVNMLTNNLGVFLFNDNFLQCFAK